MQCDKIRRSFDNYKGRYGKKLVAHFDKVVKILSTDPDPRHDDRLLRDCCMSYFEFAHDQLQTIINLMQEESNADDL